MIQSNYPPEDAELEYLDIAARDDGLSNSATGGIRLLTSQ